ncbi:MAG: 30S ribosome-binding factor RbfA, partial [Christensenellaceae bacterium]
RPNKRIIRIEEEVKRALSDIIRNDVKDDRISAMTSVTKVEITADLMFSKIYISVLDDEKNKKETIKALNHGTAFIRTKLAQAVDLRRVPKLDFVIDDSVEYSLHIAKLLEEVKNKEN